MNTTLYLYVASSFWNLQRWSSGSLGRLLKRISLTTDASLDPSRWLKLKHLVSHSWFYNLWDTVWLKSLHITFRRCSLDDAQFCFIGFIQQAFLFMELLVIIAWFSWQPVRTNSYPSRLSAGSWYDHQINLSNFIYVDCGQLPGFRVSAAIENTGSVQHIEKYHYLPARIRVSTFRHNASPSIMSPSEMVAEKNLSIGISFK